MFEVNEQIPTFRQNDAAVDLPIGR